MSKEIYCDACQKQIKVRDDLITATIMFEVAPFHENCYGTSIKGAKTLFISNEPINGFAGSAFTVFSVIIAILWAVFTEDAMRWVSLLALIPVVYRLFSYFRYERHLEK
ncbi:hypothetical protein D3H55_10260 [Bacillus salacetis]|uniref:Permease n=1 Tax=Bacillus salacetis TaxID=2315464 RepID=A0A3A1R4F8_9BACI|nr:hypothetical protein [Bacillus salacetis]RIW33974.1 hypothetical protein D3H55_10260 [Bacillus salacetis]